MTVLSHSRRLAAALAALVVLTLCVAGCVNPRHDHHVPHSRWTTPIDHPTYAGPVLSGSTLVVPTVKGFQAFSLSTGEEKWKTSTLTPHAGSFMAGQAEMERCELIPAPATVACLQDGSYSENMPKALLLVAVADGALRRVELPRAEMNSAFTTSEAGVVVIMNVDEVMTAVGFGADGAIHWSTRLDGFSTERLDRPNVFSTGDQVVVAQPDTGKVAVLDAASGTIDLTALGAAYPAGHNAFVIDDLATNTARVFVDGIATTVRFDVPVDEEVLTEQVWYRYRPDCDISTESIWPDTAPLLLCRSSTKQFQLITLTPDGERDRSRIFSPDDGTNDFVGSVQRVNDFGIVLSAWGTNIRLSPSTLATLGGFSRSETFGQCMVGGSTAIGSGESVYGYTAREAKSFKAPTIQGCTSDGQRWKKSLYQEPLHIGVYDAVAILTTDCVVSALK